MTSVFAKYQEQSYPHKFSGKINVANLMGGQPSDPKVAEGWLRSKLESSDEIILQAVAEMMAERGIDKDEALREVDNLKHLKGFARDDDGLFIKGMQLKACLKEAANIRWPRDKWGPSSKGTMGFFSEHVFVVEDRLHLGVKQADEVVQRFVHTWRGNSISYDEVVHDAEFEFSVETDFQFTDEQWGMLWNTAEHNGIGATRSQGYGSFEVVEWKTLR